MFAGFFEDAPVAAAALGVLAVVWLVFSWFEADTEIRILCSEFHPGLEREHVVHMLETGERLRYSSGPGMSRLIGVVLRSRAYERLSS